jgi:hypothetical protein
MLFPFRALVSVNTRLFQPSFISFEAGENSVKTAYSV